ncbi:sulfatase-like hydrolase/transferase [uncultured Draconibacterium sp.]|uniref:sulfatase-like hydrolase/transferase n=1 Tax=uncultured Draconibacterium sp. TaxID=1573823 RepID=UPI0025E83CC2|nr:sulfatase-like hydrolase/transferase [uncultured Draconibacterium sp.]
MRKLFFIVLIAIVALRVVAQKPNIILIESDDQSNLAVGAYGWDKVFTPNIDKIAEEGVYFTSAYNMGCWSPAVCIPSRTMLFNGVSVWRAAQLSAKNVPGPSLVERLAQVGYTTYFTGKWHALGKNPREMFHHYGHILPGQLKDYYTNQGHLTDVVGQEAVEFINQAAQENEPFFLYVAFNAPHVPRKTAQQYYNMYPPENIKLPPSVKDGPLHPNIKYNYSKNPLSSNEMRTRYQQNNAMVSHMDERIGDILEALKKTGNYDNSIIVFMSDQGINFGENGVAGKVCLYDVSATAPLIISAPGISKGKKFNKCVYLQDIYPTLLEMLDTDVPEYMEFKSLLPVLQAKTNESPHNSIYMGMFDDQRGIVHNNYKLILYTQAAEAELYNLNQDKWEMNNLMGSNIAKTIIPTLGSEFFKWQQQTGDTLDVKALFPNLFTEN